MAQLAHASTNRTDTTDVRTPVATTSTAARWEARVDEWKAKVDQYKNQLDKALAEARMDAEEELRDYRAREWEFRAKLRGLKESTGEVADELADGLDRAWDELTLAYDRAMERARN